MRLLRIINPENLDENNIPNWLHRKAARAVVLDDELKVGLLHVKKRGYYKLPGGGIKDGEDVNAALSRECREELGVEIRVIEEVGSIVEFRAQHKFFQTSYCFLARVNSEKNAPSFSEREKSFGYEVVWVKPDEALRLLNPDGKNSDDYGRKFTEERDLRFLSEAIKEMPMFN